MANEITVVGQGKNTSFALFFRYPLTAIQVGGVNVIPTPATQTPSTENPTPIPGDALPWSVRQVIAAQEIIDLDAGDAAFEIVGFHPEVGLTNAQLIAKGREIYAVRKAEYLAAYSLQYELAGTRIDEV